VTIKTKAEPRFFLEAVSGRARKALVRQRARAMAGQLDDALKLLADLSLGSESSIDRVALQLLRVELLDADYQHNEAHQVFDQSIKTEREKIPEQYWPAIDRNKIDLNSHTFHGSDEFYRLIDRERLQNIEWLDYQSLFYAHRGIEDGNRTESLQIKWRQLQTAYQSGNWFAQRNASSLFIDECLTADEPDLATLHLFLSRDEKSVKRISEATVKAASAELVRKVINRVLSSANLKAHAALGIKLLKELHDVIPDQDVPRVADWLYIYAALNYYTEMGTDPMIEAWRAMESVGERLDQQRATRWLDLLRQHPAWKSRVNDPQRFVRGRDQLLKTALPIASVLRSEQSVISNFAHESLALFSDCKLSHEYNEALNLICNLVHWGGAEIRKQVADVLYPNGQPVTYSLVSVAHHFGKQEKFSPLQLDGMAIETARQMRLQVQRLLPGQTPERPN
jgi:hypothetical protein